MMIMSSLFKSGYINKDIVTPIELSLFKCLDGCNKGLTAFRWLM